MNCIAFVLIYANQIKCYHFHSINTVSKFLLGQSLTSKLTINTYAFVHDISLTCNVYHVFFVVDAVIYIFFHVDVFLFFLVCTFYHVFFVVDVVIRTSFHVVVFPAVLSFLVRTVSSSSLAFPFFVEVFRALFSSFFFSSLQLQMILVTV